MKHSRLRAAMVGVAAVLVVLLVFLTTGQPRFFANEIPLHSFAPNAAGLGEGNAVRINGISAGKVTRIALSGEPNPQRAIRIDFVIAHRLQKQVPVDSVVSISSDSPLSGGMLLEINKGRSPKTVRADDVLTAAATPQLNQLVSQGYSVLDASQVILNKATDIIGGVEAGKGTAGKLLENQAFHQNLQFMANQVLKLGDKVDARMNGFQQLSKNVQGVAGHLNDLSQGVQSGQGSTAMVLKDSKLRNDLNESTAQWNAVNARLNAHEGTIGELMPEGKVRKQLSATVGNAQLTMDKVNAGQGTVGQFMVNPSLRDSIDGTTREAHEIMKEFRANPKKFFRIRIQVF